MQETTRHLPHRNRALVISRGYKLELGPSTRHERASNSFNGASNDVLDITTGTSGKRL
jgi:hypothetical protein